MLHSDRDFCLKLDPQSLPSQLRNKKLDTSRWIIKLGSARSIDEAYAKRLRNVRDFGLKLDSQNLPSQLQNNRKMHQNGFLN